MKIQDEFWENINLLKINDEDVNASARIRLDARDAFERADKQLNIDRSRGITIIAALSKVLQKMSPIDAALLYVNIISQNQNQHQDAARNIALNFYRNSAFWRTVAKALTSPAKRTID